MDNNLEKSQLLERETDKTDTGQDNPPKFRTDIAKGLLSAFGFVTLCATTATWVALLEKSIGDFELFALRSGFSWIMCVVVLTYRKELPTIPRRDIMNISLYSIVGNGVGLTYIAVTLIPASTVQCVAITSSIVSGVILYRIFLNETISLKNVLCAVVCSAGVVLIVQPDLLFKSVLEQNLSNISKTTSLGYFLAVIAGIMLTVEAILVKKCPFVMENFVTAIFWSSLVAAVVTASISVSVEDVTLPRTWIHGFYAFGQSVAFSLGWPTFYYAVKYLSGNTVNMVFSTSVVFFLIVQYTVLSSIHPGHRNWMEVVGVIFVLFSSILKSILEFF